MFILSGMVIVTCTGLPLGTTAKGLLSTLQFYGIFTDFFWCF